MDKELVMLTASVQLSACRLKIALTKAAVNVRLSLLLPMHRIGQR